MLLPSRGRDVSPCALEIVVLVGQGRAIRLFETGWKMLCKSSDGTFGSKEWELVPLQEGEHDAGAKAPPPRLM